MERRVVAFDLETTGLNPFHEQILEYGAVDVTGARFSALVRATVPAKITQITGITQEEVDAHGLEPVEAARAFMDFLGPRTQPLLLCAHNAAFDMNFLTNGMTKLGIEMHTDVRVLDSMSAFQLYYPHSERSRLFDMVRTVCASRGFETRHRAADDAAAVLKCVLRMGDGDAHAVARAVTARAWRGVWS
jgi:DNA polymerase III subunit alpha, Gram-positive type